MRSRSTALRVLAAGAATVVLVTGLSQITRAQQPATTRFELAPAGNEARYRVREQLAGISFPSDAVGVTSAITGGITLDATGKVVPATSKITVDITGLKSDSDRRDNFIRGRTLETAKFPNVEVAVKELRGLKYPWPATGEIKFELVGDLTAHGVTKPSVWQVTATAKSGGLAGRATTSFAFGEFGMTRPTVASVLSVEDLIKLEYDFHLVPKK